MWVSTDVTPSPLRSSPSFGGSTGANPDPTSAKSASSEQGSGDSLTLSPEAQKEVEQLKATDQRVKAHEAAHIAAGGGVVTGGATYSYKQGPDGKRYAVGGEVPLDTGEVKGNPRATLLKAAKIRSAALAPSDPSPQDRKIAAQASQMEAKASAEMLKAANSKPGSRFEAVV